MGVYSLLEITSKLTEIGDLITNKWLEVLGWISIPAVGIALVVGGIKIIITLIQKRINAKNIKPLANEIKKAREEFMNMANELKADFKAQTEEYSNAVKDGIKKGLNAYETAKTQAYNEIIKANEDVKNLIGEVKPVIVEIKEDVKNDVVEVTEEIVNNVKETYNEIKEEVSQVIENVSRETNEIKEEVKKKIDEVDDGVFER